MNKKHEELVYFLSKKEGEWITSSELASFLSVTTRTIRNRVAKINEEMPYLIEASTSGYRLQKETYETLTKNTESTELNNQSRDSLILLELLKNSKKGIDVFYLSDKLYISESTLRNDIQRIKQTLPSDKLVVSVKNDVVKLIGDEKYKRQYMVTLLYSESDMQRELSKTIQKMIGYISLNDLRQTIKTILNNHHTNINQYALDNVALHFAVSIERINQGYFLSEDKQHNRMALDLKRELNMTREIVEQLSKQYHLQFPEIEMLQLSLQFVGLQDKGISYTDQTNITKYVDEKIIGALRETLFQTKETYLIDFDDDEFFNKLAVHLQSLYYRSKFKTFTRNSSILDIKINYPLIYDISIYISSLIQEKLNIQFKEDEIAFIALHVGSLLEKKKTSKKNIQLLLFANDYHNITEQMKQTIETSLDSSIVVSTIDMLEELEYRSYDLLVTTNREVATRFDDSVFVKPFLTKRDLSVLRKRVEQKEQARKKEAHYHLIDTYFSPHLFFNKLDTTDMGVTDIINKMIEDLSAQAYVDDSFYESVRKREAMSPTSFPSNIAVPHSVELDALKSGISILTLQEPIKWADYNVTMVAMVAINKEDSQEFGKLFEIFTEIASESYNVDRLTAAENFEEFVMHLKLMIDDLT